MAQIGKIPYNLKYYCQSKEITIEGVQALPTFVVNADSENLCETAEHWATKHEYQGQGKPSKINAPIILSYPNDPITKITIVDLEKRGEGGRAYKVIFEQNGKNHYVDLREDVLIDVIKNCGIEAGGRLIGEFVWGQFGSQMKLMRVDSDLYREAMETATKGNISKIKSSDLKIGHLYETQNGSKAIFLGRVRGIALHNMGLVNGIRLIGQKLIAPHLFFLEVPSWRKDLKEHINECIYDAKTPYYFQMKKSHTFRVDRGKVLDSFDLRDHISKLKVSAIEIFEKEAIRWTGYPDNQLDYLIHIAETLNIAIADEKPTLHQYIIDWIGKWPTRYKI